MQTESGFLVTGPA